jgi:hypothetical protein
MQEPDSREVRHGERGALLAGSSLLGCGTPDHPYNLLQSCGLMLARQALYHLSHAPFCFQLVFEAESHINFAQAGLHFLSS